ncbi:cytochrome c oxidase accessory protein CcoG [Aureliella helgolandensis]|uniref:Electron transport protein YccM n=1 Tax=Aureliella helgolandensis TaxID=2527968 RepID=A0A518FZK3_9BACT|nr:cytochrome c oxidase accessory protein CcoG [Aureliella helgolandensis]QDV21785.1 Putative electron transport protein YccM [Aureliella helgolandensis]
MAKLVTTPNNNPNSSPRALPIVDRDPNTESAGDSAVLESPEYVLSTLHRDGQRRWLKPRLSQGYWWKNRRVVSYVLMVIFVLVPHLRFMGKPPIQLNIPAREFTIMGHTFLPTDTMLLALTMLTAFLGVVLVTAIAGRAWCGWACPQTVYMEFLFRPIDRIFEGTSGKGGLPKQPLSPARQIGRFLVYVLLNMLLAHTFLSYFVGTEELARWIRSSPFEHPAAFLVMATTTALLTFDFYYFREQTCLIACPYGRLQSVMLDRQSMIVAYDYNRGEPRKKGKHRPEDQAGDCVDCNQCVVVCPTGIDIRDGLQMECINCTQCIDACDSVMKKVGTPQGLIRFSSQDELSGKRPRFLRARTVAYPILLMAVAGSLVYGITTKSSFDARVLRGKGAPYTNVARGEISNTFNMRLVNRSNSPQTYTMTVQSPKKAQLEIIDDAGLSLAPGKSALVPLQVRFSGSLTFGTGSTPMQLLIEDSSDHQRVTEFSLIGPRQ